VLPFADGTVLFAGATLFRQVALRAMGRTLHGGLSGKLYLSMGGWGKAKVGRVRRVVYLAFWTHHDLLQPDSGSLAPCFNFPDLPAAVGTRLLCS
jgi:hypothetical protein